MAVYLLEGMMNSASLWTELYFTGIFWHFYGTVTENSTAAEAFRCLQ